ncbi:MAG: TonB-dependent receptor plug domain-containing protein, partial [Woeseiaceae bacterium]
MLRSILLLAATVAPLTSAAENNEIDEVVVTATRRAVSSADVSSGLTVLGRDKVQAEKLVTDALASNVGVFLQQTTPGQGAPIIRGLKGSSILHLVDGLRLNNAIFRSAPTQYFALVPVSSVERVEVLRGT